VPAVRCDTDPSELCFQGSLRLIYQLWAKLPLGLIRGVRGVRLYFRETFCGCEMNSGDPAEILLLQLRAAVGFKTLNQLFLLVRDLRFSRRWRFKPRSSELWCRVAPTLRRAMLPPFLGALSPFPVPFTSLWRWRQRDPRNVGILPHHYTASQPMRAQLEIRSDNAASLFTLKMETGWPYETLAPYHITTGC
jgi:hypothetical protein